MHACNISLSLSIYLSIYLFLSLSLSLYTYISKTHLPCIYGNGGSGLRSRPLPRGAPLPRLPRLPCYAPRSEAPQGPGEKKSAPPDRPHGSLGGLGLPPSDVLGHLAPPSHITTRYAYMCVHLFIYIYIYICIIEREREREVLTTYRFHLRFTIGTTLHTLRRYTSGNDFYPPTRHTCDPLHVWAQDSLTHPSLTPVIPL